MNTTPLASPDAVPALAEADVAVAAARLYPSASDIRAEAAQLRDAELVERFIAERCSRSLNTEQSYRAQLRRLAWFCRHQGLQTIRQFARAHWPEFKKYLANPPEEHRMKRSVGVEHPDYKPFRTALSERSVEQALAVVRSFFAWMADASIGAIEVNPIGTMKAEVVRTSRSNAAIERFFTDHQFSYIERALVQMPADTLEQQLEKVRAAWVISLAVHSGLRASEIAAARRHMIKASTVRERYDLHITRKGRVKAKLALHTKIMEHYRDYIRHYPELAGMSDVPLVVPLRLAKRDIEAGTVPSLRRNAIWQIVKDVVKAATALAVQDGDGDSAKKLQHGSTHWLRHTFGTRLVENGADLVEARDLLDHASIDTTSLYLHKPAEKHHAALDLIP